jgi:hypothetical protein
VAVFCTFLSPPLHYRHFLVFPARPLACLGYQVDTIGAMTIQRVLFIRTVLTNFSGNNASSTPASQPQSSGGLFGSTPAQPAQSGSLFGGQPAQSSQPQSGGLFGNMNKPATPAPATGGLFGSSTAQSSQPASGGLFGGALGASTQTQPQTGAAPSGGLFGGGQQAKPSLL